MAAEAPIAEKPKSNWCRSEKQFSVQDIESGSVALHEGRDALLMNDLLV